VLAANVRMSPQASQRFTVQADDYDFDPRTQSQKSDMTPVKTSVAARLAGG
jgi:hypothetical protein